MAICAQSAKQSINSDSVSVESSVEFFTYNGPYGSMEHISEPAVRFILTILNKGNNPIPDLGVSNRSQFVNLYINDSLSNPVSMYNGVEATNNDHMLRKNVKDTYAWWVFEKDAYANVFTVQWEYMGVISKKIKVNIANRTTEVIR